MPSTCYRYSVLITTLSVIGPTSLKYVKSGGNFAACPLPFMLAGRSNCTLDPEVTYSVSPEESAKLDRYLFIVSA